MAEYGVYRAFFCVSDIECHLIRNAYALLVASTPRPRRRGKGKEVRGESTRLPASIRDRGFRVRAAGPAKSDCRGLLKPGVRSSPSHSPHAPTHLTAPTFSLRGIHAYMTGLNSARSMPNSVPCRLTATAVKALIENPLSPRSPPGCRRLLTRERTSTNEMPDGVTVTHL